MCVCVCVSVLLCPPEKRDETEKAVKVDIIIRRMKFQCKRDPSLFPVPFHSLTIMHHDMRVRVEEDAKRRRIRNGTRSLDHKSEPKRRNGRKGTLPGRIAAQLHDHLK